jgi:hypothetical protein
LATCTVAVLLWWAASRARTPALLAAVGLITLASSEPVRIMSLQSHLVAMAALEVVLVAAPLLVITALRTAHARVTVGGSKLWTACVVTAALLNSVFLVALHIPQIHVRGMGLAAVPLWLTGVAVLVGLGFWAAILLTGGHVQPALRRRALIVSQEVAVILGLAALLVPSPYPHHANPLRLTAELDQRLGGALMVLTCAAVTLPLARRLQERQATQPIRMERHVN